MSWMLFLFSSSYFHVAVCGAWKKRNGVSSQGLVQPGCLTEGGRERSRPGRKCLCDAGFLTCGIRASGGEVQQMSTASRGEGAR